MVGQLFVRDAAPGENLRTSSWLSCSSEGPMRLLPSGPMKCTPLSPEDTLTWTRGMVSIVAGRAVEEFSAARRGIAANCGGI
jgi:hypothetical protein